MDISVVVASINKLENIEQIKNVLIHNDVELLVIDEGDQHVRKKNSEILTGLNHKYYGPSERKKWFDMRFGGSAQKYQEVIPNQCHAETSFGFLATYEKNPDMILELDDDVFPLNDNNIINLHSENLFGKTGITIDSESKWYNTIENLDISFPFCSFFPRGHPYSDDTRSNEYSLSERGGLCVLNMGLWTGNLDLDALTLLYNGGLDGRLFVEGEKCKRNKVIIGLGTYFATCSMNTAFKPEIIPAFFQLYMNFMGIDRFDDIWSGLFLKKIADQLGHKICVGQPVVNHNKRPRDVFSDLRKELEGLIMNETLWKMVEKTELSGNDYWTCYSSLIDGLKKDLKDFKIPCHRKFVKKQLEKMNLWLKILDKIC